MQFANFSVNIFPLQLSWRERIVEVIRDTADYSGKEGLTHTVPSHNYNMTLYSFLYLDMLF